MERLAPLLQSSPRKEWLDEIADWKANFPFSYPPAPEGLIRPQQVIEELAKQTKGKDLIVSTGVGEYYMVCF
jgi:acetolactate synthase-1/2/3 large subunit